MAVNPDVIKARLRAKFPKANLSKERLDEISARLSKLPTDDADETAVDAVLDSANEIFSFDEIARNDDTIRTLKAKSQDPQPKPTDDPKPIDPTPKPVDNTPEWAKAMMATIQKQATDLEELKSGKITETKMQQLNTLFDSNPVLKNLPEGVKNRALKTIDLDQDLTEQVEAASNDFKDFVQSSINSNEYAGAPGKGYGNNGPSQQEVDALAETLVNNN